jgi:hypothetical protein
VLNFFQPNQIFQVIFSGAPVLKPNVIRLKKKCIVDYKHSSLLIKMCNYNKNDLVVLNYSQPNQIFQVN